MEKNVETAKSRTWKDLISDNRVIGGAVLFVLVTVMFAVSVNMRSEYKDYVSFDHHHHLTATSVIFTNNWLDDGIVSDRFAMIPNPDSVEFSDLQDRSFYDSYPSGCILPLYFLAKISGTDEIGFGFVQRWNLFNQYMVTLIMAFIIYLLFLKIGKKFYIGLIAAIAPAAVNLFMPAPFYFFHSAYFADMAVILPFVLTVFLELLRMYTDKPKARKVISIIEGVVIFAGTFTDYLFLCLVAVLYVKRLILGEISLKKIGAWFKDSIKFAAPAILAVGLFVIQIIVNGPVRIIDMFLFRTGMEDSTGWTQAFADTFWKKYIVDGYGNYADIIIKVSLGIVIAAIIIYFAAKKLKKYKNENIVYILTAAAIVIIPCFMQVYLLKNHSAIHDFSSLKFSVVMSLVSYALIPALVAEVINAAAAKKINSKIVTGAVMTAAVVICCVNVYSAHTEKAESFFPEATEECQTVGAFLRENTDYNDVVFSDNYQIQDSNNYPAKLAFSKKRVYKVSNADQIYSKVKNIDDDYTINIFRYGDEDLSDDIQKLVETASETIREGNMVLYKIESE